ncbi:MAG: hypothetical protein A2566_01465 [Candidatus Zambryskibacteria bacterium RIFOXYD1_FULL_40_13]|nr:MAG: hypothetical protein UT25_C0005G0031 [Parcubacteria group bacterium GW2011_GWC1_39_12]KKR19192.1 MAG: hypothetical protein UT49_C0002G0038 [Parcubacteria group bacterium GW2011_GWF1_39_37]KKR34886.1 MAG: hypothetical protein UT68_C0007G0037 [Parcubacteria group bacterium GW2011_GWC2_40_10]KKR52121.1 MAG: hypothetical protein UT89_C0003G0057 [Parcubacteria group bacterium GW2011_GWE1_40_20]KKR66128.1 MAG: hypothetical protein UU06_C0005G0018 [Parcubacteria group bacterium GW2011_GWB1_40_
MKELTGKIAETFIFPDIEKEHGEIERVAQKYSPQNPEAFIRTFYEKVQSSRIVDLTEEMWATLDNTDSFDIPHDGWEQVKGHIDHTNQETRASRSWEELKQKMELGQELGAPIILKYFNETHLVSGNTRLMVARALRKTPKILLVEM